MLVLVVGPSGAGKDTLLNAARAAIGDDPAFRFARRDITRPAGEGGEDHRPVDEPTFLARRDAGRYALWWQAHGLSYGIAADIVDDLARGATVIASVSRGVIAAAATRFQVRVVEITAPPEVLAARLSARAREGADDIARRLLRNVAMPTDVDVITVMNDGTIEQGAARLLEAFRSKCVQAAGRAGRAAPPP